MKYFLLISMMFSVTSSFAQDTSERTKPRSKKFSRPYGIAGCGLGSVIVGKRGGQIFAATTNGSSLNQMFGISFGSLNCVDAPENKVAHNMDLFIINNRAQLEVNAVQGQGEAIAALSQLMGCKGSNNRLGQLLKAQYSEIFTQEIQGNEITDRIIESVLNEDDLASSCQLS